MCRILRGYLGLLVAAACCLGPSSAWARPELTVPRHEPCNLFTPSEAIQFDVQLKGFDAGDGTIIASVRDYSGREVWTATQPLRVEAGRPTTVPLKIGTPREGYYELTINAGTRSAAATQPTQATQKVSFGVAPFVDRSAEQVRNGGYRFGLKRWNFSRNPSPNQWSVEDGVAACCKLGLQWTREMFNHQEPLGTVEMVKKYPMNVVLKVERFPKELYDADRYGPMEQWEQKFGRGAWTLKTLPKKNEYQKWLREQIAQIPPEQNVFEIWNEAWDKMSPEDFATICQWIVPVILELRPNAIIGPNLLGNTSPYQFDARVIKAGGMNGMKMVALHPYAGSEDRAWLRDYRKWLSGQLGRDMEIYVTEFGSHSTPQGPARRSEHEQAQRVVRQALALYVEDVKAFMPHWMGQTEKNPTYIEDWFGFFRFNRQPKPVLLAYANAARLVDGSRYVGDLWYGPECDAMLFEKGGVYTLALFTRGNEKEVQVEPGVAQVTICDMVGASRVQPVENGKLRLNVGADAQYLVGVGPELAKQASKELRADRWPEPARPPRVTRAARPLATFPTLDGNLDEWAKTLQLALLNPKVNPETDASGMAYVSWDSQYLYVALAVRDNEVLNVQPRAKLYRQDSLELFVSTEPRDNNAGYGPHDHQFFITPASGEGKPMLGEVTDREAGKVEDVAGAKFFAGPAGKGWAAEVAIPWSLFKGFTPAKGARLALDMRLNDADSVHERFKLDPVDANLKDSDPTTWSYLVLADANEPLPANAAVPTPVAVAQAAAMVAEWQFNADADLPGKAVLKLDSASPRASRESRLMEKSSFVAGPTGIGPKWKAFLAKGYLKAEKGAGANSAALHGLVLSDSNPRPGGEENDNSEYSDVMGFTGLGASPRGGTVYLVVQPNSDWSDGRRGLMGTGHGFGHRASPGSLGLSIDKGVLCWRVGRGENATQAGHQAPVGDLNGDGDQDDFVYAESTVTRTWDPRKWYFIAANWQEGAAPVLYMRELGEDPASSPVATLGNATAVKGNAVAVVPSGSTGPQYDPFAIGALWVNHGVPQTRDGADAKIAYARIDNVCASAQQMAQVFAGLAADK